jgi:hypothetical protein
MALDGSGARYPLTNSLGPWSPWKPFDRLRSIDPRPEACGLGEAPGGGRAWTPGGEACALRRLKSVAPAEIGPVAATTRTRGVVGGRLLMACEGIAGPRTARGDRPGFRRGTLCTDPALCASLRVIRSWTVSPRNLFAHAPSKEVLRSRRLAWCRRRWRYPCCRLPRSRAVLATTPAGGRGVPRLTLFFCS